VSFSFLIFYLFIQSTKFQSEILAILILIILSLAFLILWFSFKILVIDLSNSLICKGIWFLDLKFEKKTSFKFLEIRSDSNNQKEAFLILDDKIKIRLIKSRSKKMLQEKLKEISLKLSIDFKSE